MLRLGYSPWATGCTDSLRIDPSAVPYLAEYLTAFLLKNVVGGFKVQVQWVADFVIAGTVVWRGSVEVRHWSARLDLYHWE